MLTIAIPFHSDVGYLRRAVASVLRQTSDAWRLIIRNDNPNVDLGDEFTHPRITCLWAADGRGMVANWNACLDLADTELVTLLHGDDELEPTYVETMLTLAQENPDAAAFFCNAVVIDEQGEPFFSFPDWYKRLLTPDAKNGLVRLQGEPGVRTLLRGNFIFCPSLCFVRRRLGPVRFEPRWQMVQDLELTIRLLCSGETLLGAEASAYRYRRHRANATVAHTASLLRFDEEAALYEVVAQQCAGKGWEAAARMARRKTVLKLNLAWCLGMDALHLRGPDAVRKARKLWEML